jgi:hypothetical protein
MSIVREDASITTQRSDENGLKARVNVKSPNLPMIRLIEILFVYLNRNIDGNGNLFALGGDGYMWTKGSSIG